MRRPCDIEGPVDRAADRPLASRPGVLELVAKGSGEAVTVVATGDLRAALERRLTPAPGRPDLAAVTGSVRAWVCGSLVEAELLWLEIARARTPRTYGAALDRWRGWFIAIDPEGDLPVWARVDLGELISDEPPAGAVIGPMATKDAAKRYGRELDELFELCREPERLARRPDATACMYKEMGACPAACDGSEPIEAYRARAHGAIRLAREGVTVERARIDADMRGAAAETDFERAGRIKARMDRLDDLDRPAWKRVTTLDRLAVVFVQPSGKKGWARTIVHAGGETRWFGDVEAVRADPGFVEALGKEVSARRGAFALDRARAERIGLVCHRLFHPGRGSGSVLDASKGLAPREFWRAARRAARIEREEADPAAGEAEAGT